MGKRSGGQGLAIDDARARVCVLHGPEAMLKRQHLERLKGSLESAYGEVEVVQFDGKSVGLAQVLDELRSFGLMQQYKLVVVDEAEGFISAHRSVLERYAQSPVDHATLVLRSGRWHRGKLDQLIQKVGWLVKCEPMSAAGAKAWLIDRAKTVHGRRIDSQAAAMMVDRLGRGDLLRLDTELSKLALMVDKDQPIGVEMVVAVVARGSEDQAWVVQEAIMEALGSASRRQAGGGGASGGAIDKVHELVDVAGQPEVMVSYFVADLFRKLQLAVMMKRQGMTDRQIGGELKLWGPRLSAFMGVLRGLDDLSAAVLLDKIINLDMRAKSGRGNPVRNLECFFAGMAKPMTLGAPSKYVR